MELVLVIIGGIGIALSIHAAIWPRRWAIISERKGQWANFQCTFLIVGGFYGWYGLMQCGLEMLIGQGWAEVLAVFPTLGIACVFSAAGQRGIKLMMLEGTLTYRDLHPRRFVGRQLTPQPRQKELHSPPRSGCSASPASGVAGRLWKPAGCRRLKRRFVCGSRRPLAMPGDEASGQRTRNTAAAGSVRG